MSMLATLSFTLILGVKKSQSDVKRITHYTMYSNGEKVDVTKELEKAYKESNASGTKVNRLELGKSMFGNTFSEEDEIILNCKLVPYEIIDTEREVLCSEVEDLEYNVEKYIEQFNSRIKPLLVCFDPHIRDSILIKDPKDRKFFTNDETKLVSGFPAKEGDQDTYEQLMRPEKKEIGYWLSIGQVPPFVKECGIDWGALVEEYKREEEQESNELFEAENSKYLEALNNLTNDDIKAFEEEGKVPASIASIVSIDSSTMRFVFKKIEGVNPSTRRICLR